MPSTSPRRETTNDPLHWKSNNRETSFRKATISTPIEQTRFLLVIKLSFSFSSFRCASRKLFAQPSSLSSSSSFSFRFFRVHEIFFERIEENSLFLCQTLTGGFLVPSSIHANFTRSCLKFLKFNREWYIIVHVAI